MNQERFFRLWLLITCLRKDLSLSSAKEIADKIDFYGAFIERP